MTALCESYIAAKIVFRLLIGEKPPAWFISSVVALESASNSFRLLGRGFMFDRLAVVALLDVETSAEFSVLSVI